jgi:P27 family predicted phage terminase small subunit
MGRRGPQPTPTKVLELRGSWLAKTRRGEPQPDAVIPDKPGWLEDDASVAWDRLTQQLHAIGLIAQIDENALARYCRLWQRWRQMERQIDIDGTVKVFKDDDGHIIAEDVSRAVAIAGNLADKLLKLEHEFGMTASARAALGVTIARNDASRKKPKQRKAPLLAVG